MQVNCCFEYSILGYASNDGMLNQEETSISLEEHGQGLQTVGKSKEINCTVGDTGTQQTSPETLEEEAIEAVLSTSNNREESTGKVHFTKSHSQAFSHSQTGNPVTQFQGLTPVKFSRKELRHIPASELSSRRATINCVAADSIEMPRKSHDYTM